MLEQYRWQSPNSSASVFDGGQLPRAPCLGSSNPSHQVEIEWRKGEGVEPEDKAAGWDSEGCPPPLPSGPCSLMTVDRGRGSRGQGKGGWLAPSLLLAGPGGRGALGNAAALLLGPSNPLSQ